jgi:hypothetical protein
MGGTYGTHGEDEMRTRIWSENLKNHLWNLGVDGRKLLQGTLKE